GGAGGGGEERVSTGEAFIGFPLDRVSAAVPPGGDPRLEAESIDPGELTKESTAQEKTQASATTLDCRIQGGVQTAGPHGGRRSGSQAWTQQLPAAEHICFRSASSMVGQARPQLPQLSGSERARQLGGAPHGSGSNSALHARPQVQTPLIWEQVANPLAIPGHCCVPPQVCG